VIGSYRFKEFSQVEGQVLCVVEWSGPMKKPIPLEEVKEIMEDLGKWEALEKAVHDLGIVKTTAPLPARFGRIRYEIDVQKSPRSVDNMFEKQANVNFTLTEEEALARTKGKDTMESPDLHEIESQVESLAKWRNFANLVKHVKEIDQTLPAGTMTHPLASELPTVGATQALLCLVPLAGCENPLQQF
jgi:hypothetical protein